MKTRMNGDARQETAAADEAGGAEAEQGTAPPTLWARMKYAFGPVLTGLLIDMVDLATFGPFKIYMGFVVGFGLAYYLMLWMGLSMRWRLMWAFAAGVYCTIPGLEFLPVGTIVGACARFWEAGRPPRED